MQNPSHKIAIVSHTLGSGGAERFSAVLGQMLDGLGYEIHHITINEAVDYEFAGKLYNLGQICSGHNFIKRKFSKGILIKRYLDGNQIDTIIDNRSRNIFIREWFAKRIFGSRKRYGVVHSFHIADYFPKSRFLAQLLYADAQKIVCVSKAIEAEIQKQYALKNTVTIYNPVDFSKLLAQNENVGSGKYVLFSGRFDDQVKNFGLLIEGFALSKIHELGYRLLIMGTGPDSQVIQKYIKAYNLEPFAEIVPFQNNPFTFVKNARFTVLTSRYEGFPMSLIESLALGVPVVSVDCQSGPSEIIQDERNGLLVPNYDSGALAKAIARLAQDADLYDICKTNAAASVAHLAVEQIALQWQQILEK